MNKLQWQLVGRICTDVAMVILVDPLYIRDRDHTWNKLIDHLEGNDNPLIDNDYFNTLSGNEESLYNLGIIAKSGIGDGVYEVYAKIGDYEGWGERVWELKVVFLPYRFDEDGSKQKGSNGRSIVNEPC